MKIVNLIEDTQGNNNCNIEHGLSFYIETPRHKLLFDLGASDLFIQNAKKRNIDLADVDTVIISHGHYDHGGGLASFLHINDKAKIYLRDTAFDDFYSLNHEPPKYIGLDKSLQGNERFVYIKDDLHRIDSELVLFANMDSTNSPSANQQLKKTKDLIPDSFDHEQCLSILAENQRILLSGCAHHGILNILDKYKELFGKEPDVVISGFHMEKKSSYSDEDINNIIDTALALKKYSTRFYTCHCTGMAPYQAMRKIMGNQLSYIHCGDEIKLKKKRNEYMKLHKLFAWGTVFCFAMTMVTGYKRK